MKDIKDKQGKELNRPFAPNKRPKPEDAYKVRVVEPDEDKTKQSTARGRFIVK